MRNLFSGLALLLVAVAGWQVAGCQAAGDGAGVESATLPGDAAARIKAAKELALAKDPASAGTLVACLTDPEPIVRRMAIYGLQRIGDASSAAAILPLVDDKDVWVRRTAVTALGKLRRRVAVPALVRLLGDDNVHVRLEAFLALGRIGDASTQKAIMAAMRDKRLWTELGIWDQMSILAVVDRTWFTDRAVVPVLKWLLTYGTWDHPELADLEASRRDRFAMMIGNRAGEILAVKFGDASGESFIVQGLAPGDDYMQQSSAHAAGAIRSKKAVPGLVAMLGSEWINNRQYAIDALGAIGDLSSVPALEKVLAGEDVGLRRHAVMALAKIDGTKRQTDLGDPEAVIPEIAPADLKTPGNKRPPMFICLGVDDCVNIEGIESILDIVETLHDHGRKVVFTLWIAPLAGEPATRDMVKQKLIYQRLFDLGTEVAHHTLHHNPGGRNWSSLPPERQVEEIEGCTQWYRDHIDGFTRPFTHKGGGGGQGAPVDRAFTRALIGRQKFLYWGRRGQHPNEQGWPQNRDGTWLIPTGMQDGNAPPVHARITRPIRSDYPGQFDYELSDGLAMMKANFDYRYGHPRRPIFAINAFHDWGFKTPDDSTCKHSHRNEAAILKAFLMDVLVTNKDKYPDAHCVTFRQVVEYTHTGGDLKHTLAAGNCQDSRNPVKPKLD